LPLFFFPTTSMWAAALCFLYEGLTEVLN
jgi:hypothetical protein